MAHVHLRYFTNSSRQETIKVKLDERKLNLSQLGITSIDLTPLRYCTEIRHLDLSGNEIEQIDFNPVSAFKNFYKCDISNNQIKNINISPLMFCNNLSQMEYDRDAKLTIDPIAHYALGNYMLVNIDSIITVYPNYEAIMEEMPWRTILANTRELLRILPRRQWFPAQRGFLIGMGLDELAAFDGYPYLLLSDISTSLSFEEAKEKIQLRLIGLLEKQIKGGGSTHYLEVDELAKGPGAILISDIVENRKQELTKVKIERINDRIDARIFYFTTYGRQILREMGFNPTKKHGITATKILETMSHAGFSLDIVDVSHQSDDQWRHLSSSLIYYLENDARCFRFVKDLAKD